MSGKLNRTKSHYKSKKREEYLRDIQQKLWSGQDMPNLPAEAVADFATELFSASCGARKLAGLHLPEAVRESCKGRISPCSLVLALLYLERLKAGGEIATDYLSDVTPSELFIVSMMVANKFLQDEGDTSEVENWFWSELSGFDVDHVNMLEKNFLSAIQWEVFVSRAEFWRRMHSLYRTVALRQGSQRGWFTYEETSALLDNLPLTNLLQSILQVSAVCLASYAAAFMALLAAALLSAHAQRLLLLANSSSDLGMSSVPSSVCLPILESWVVSLPDLPNLATLPAWQEDAENVTDDSLVRNISLPTPARHHTDYTLQQIISYLTPAATRTWALVEAKKEIPLFHLKGVI